jgi:hypothetical protein
MEKWIRVGRVIRGMSAVIERTYRVMGYLLAIGWSSFSCSKSQRLP